MILAFGSAILLVGGTQASLSNSPGPGEQNAYLEVGNGLLIDEFRARMISVVACREMVVADWREREAVWRACWPNEAAKATPMTAAKEHELLVGTQC